MGQVEDALRRFVINNFLYGRGERLCNDDSFLRMGIIDSTGMLELVNFLETTYKIEVTDAELVPENLDSITQLAHFIEKKQLSRFAAPRQLSVESIFSD
jgi:acyl carrier protein